jgi:hypothetical protein
MYTDSKIIGMVSRSFFFSPSFTFIFLLLILIISIRSSGTITPSLNNNIHNFYALAENGGNNRNIDTSAKVGDQIQPFGNNLQDAKTISPDSSLTLSPSQDSKVQKDTSPNSNLNPNNQNLNIAKGNFASADQNVNPNSNLNSNTQSSANTNPYATANTNNNPSLPDLSFKSPSQEYNAEKTVTPLSDSKSPTFDYKRAEAHVTVITKNLIPQVSLSDIQTCLYTRVDKSPGSYGRADPANPQCAPVSESGVSFSVPAPRYLVVVPVGSFGKAAPDDISSHIKMDNDCINNDTYISIGESKTCTLTFRNG